MISRISAFALTLLRQAVPIGGVVGAGWHPVAAVSIYWVESVLLVLVAAVLCTLMQRRVSPGDIAEAQRAGDLDAVRALQTERAAIDSAHLNAGGLVLFHGVGLLVFGIVGGVVMLIMMEKGSIEQRVEWRKLRDGALAMTTLVVAGFLIDLWSFRRLPAAAVESRGDACTGRWALFWMMGFFGIAIIIITSRPMWFFALFSGLKLTFETWGSLARFFGWRSLKSQANP